MTIEQANLSPLDQIRQTEAEVTRGIAAARTTAEQKIEAAKEEADRLKAQAYQAGLCKGQEQFREIVTQAEKEAQALAVQARLKVEELRRKGEMFMEAAVQFGVNYIIGEQDH